MGRCVMLQESQGIHVRVRRDMVDCGVEVLRCAQLGREDAAVKGQVGSTRVGQDSVHWKEVVVWPSIGVPSIQAGLARHAHALELGHLHHGVTPLQHLSCFYHLFLDHHDVRPGCHGHGHDQCYPWWCARIGRRRQDHLLRHANALERQAARSML